MIQIKELIENMQLLSFNVRHYFQKRIASLELDVTYEMVRVLFILSQKEHMNQQQLADITFKNKASLTSMIDNMEKRGLVVRKEDTVDRRNKIICLTEKGGKMTERVRPLFEEMFASLYQDVSEEELRIMSKVIKKMNQQIV